MWDNIIGRQIRRSTRNLLIWNSLILIGIIVFFVVSNRYWYNFFLGPFTPGREELVAKTNDSGYQYFVTTRADACFDTGLRYEVTKKRGGRRETAKYFALIYNDKILIAKTDMDASTTELERRGVLENVPADVKLKISTELDAAFARNPAPVAARPTILPVMLDTTITRTKGYIALAVLIPLGLINIFNIFKAFSRFGNPQHHPLAKNLIKYGDPEEVAQKIDDEYNSDDREQIGPVTFTRSWMIRPTTFGVDAAFLGDSAWAYKTVTQHYTNGIPTGKSYAGNLCDIHGAQLTVPLKSEQQTDEFVLAVFHRVPWVLAGFDAELEQMWKKDKSKLYAIVEERRQKLAEKIRRQREAPDEEPPAGEAPLDVEPA